MAVVRESSVEQTGGNSFTKPTGVVDGSVLEILYWQFHDGSTPPSAPSGFSETTGGGQVNQGANGFSEARRYRKVITNAAGEPASYTVTRGSGTTFADGGEIFRLSGVNTSNPENATVTFGTGTGTTATSGSLTTTVADCLLSAVIVNDGASISVPAGMSALFLHDGGDAEGYTETLSGTVTGATRSSTIGASQEWGFGLWAIEPAGAGGATPKGPLGNPFFGPFGGPI